jgi:hypothetical protein
MGTALAAAAWMQLAFMAPLVESVPPRMYGGTERVVHGWITRRDHALT